MGGAWSLVLFYCLMTGNCQDSTQWQNTYSGTYQERKLSYHTFNDCMADGPNQGALFTAVHPEYYIVQAWCVHGTPKGL